MKRSLAITFGLVLLMMLAACSSAATPAADRSFGVYDNKGISQEAVPVAPAEAPAAAAGDTSNAFNSEADQPDRLVIRNADLTIIVDKPTTALDSILKMADTMGGYVVSSQQYQRTLSQGNQVTEASVTIRVPAAKLDDALSQIKGLVKDADIDVTNENITGQDVTKDYTDLQSRLRNLQAASDQLTELMGKATKPDDVLAIFNELKDVNEQIEVIKGQIQYYEESAAMSAISVTIQATASIAPVTIAGWQPKGVARDALQALVKAYQVLVNVVIWSVIFCLPILIPIALVVFFIVKGIQRYRKNRKVKAGPVEPPVQKSS